MTERLTSDAVPALDAYELLDFGRERKLERFGEVVVDRPAPGVTSPIANPSAWASANARYDRTAQVGQWHIVRGPSSSWSFQHARFRLELKLAESGQVGVFAEQAPNWEWMARRVQLGRPGVKILNLFAYTGASTLACAQAGAEVVHLDGSRAAVEWARRNARRSQLADRTIRWIVEDALTFVRRELKRGRPYDAVILDPPSYGHGPAGQVWRLESDLPDLLRSCAELTRSHRSFMLLTCHTTGVDSDMLATLLGEALDEPRVASGAMTLIATDGRQLPRGAMARWPAE